MTAYSEEEVERQYNKLPEILQSSIFDPEIANKIVGVGKKFGLTVEQIGFLAEEAGYVVLGLTQSVEFVQQLADRLGVDADQAREIAKEINHQIFYQLREALKTTHQIEMRDEDIQKAEVAVKPQPAPAPIRPAAPKPSTPTPSVTPAPPPASTPTSITPPPPPPLPKTEVKIPPFTQKFATPTVLPKPPTIDLRSTPPTVPPSSPTVPVEIPQKIILAPFPATSKHPAVASSKPPFVLPAVLPKIPPALPPTIRQEPITEKKPEATFEVPTFRRPPPPLIPKAEPQIEIKPSAEPATTKSGPETKKEMYSIIDLTRKQPPEPPPFASSKIPPINLRSPTSPVNEEKPPEKKPQISEIKGDPYREPVG